MKIVDQTPFYKENGELSLIDRVRAIHGIWPWLVQGDRSTKSVIAVLKKTLDKNYTLLCNITPPGLDARIPLILVGPTGVYVMIVTPKIGHVPRQRRSVGHNFRQRPQARKSQPAYPHRTDGPCHPGLSCSARAI